MCKPRRQPSSAAAACTASMAESAPPLTPTAIESTDAGRLSSAREIAPVNAARPNIAPARPLAVDLLEAAVRHQALEAMLDELVRRHARQLPQRIGKRPAQLTRHGGRIAVGRAHGHIEDTDIHPKQPGKGRGRADMAERG